MRYCAELSGLYTSQGIFNAIFRRFDFRSQSPLNEIHDASSNYVRYRSC